MFERFTEKAIKTVMLSQEEARRVGHNYIGTEHMLLGLIREGEGVAMRVLQDLDVNLPELRQTVLKLLGESGAIPAQEEMSLDEYVTKMLEKKILEKTHNVVKVLKALIIGDASLKKETDYENKAEELISLIMKGQEI